MLFGFESYTGLVNNSMKNLLLIEAEMAFEANDQASCIAAIARLYDLFDGAFSSPRSHRHRKDAPRINLPQGLPTLFVPCTKTQTSPAVSHNCGQKAR